MTPQIILVALTVLHIALSVVEGRCTVEELRSYNQLIRPWSGILLEVENNGGVPNVELDNFDPGRSDNFMFELQFYLCTDRNEDLFSIRTLSSINGRRYYLANRGNDNIPDLVVDNGAPFINGRDQRLFAYTGGSSMDLTDIESTDGYLSAGPQTSVIYDPTRFQWVSWPFITRINSTVFEGTRLNVTFRINRRDRPAALYFNSQPRISVSPTNFHGFDRLTDKELLLEVINWGLFQGFLNNGTIIHGQAVIFRHPNKMYYIAPHTTEGRVNLRHGVCVVTRSFWHHKICLPYSPIQFNFYDDVARSRNSTFSKPDIRNMNVVDERFFEILRQPNGKARFRSVIDPDIYLAVIRFSRHNYKLVVTKLNERLRGVVQYDFTHSVRMLMGTVMMRPRLPCGPDTLEMNRYQSEFFQCA